MKQIPAASLNYRTSNILPPVSLLVALLCFAPQQELSIQSHSFMSLAVPS